MYKLLNNRFAVWISFITAFLSKSLLLYNYRIVDGDKIMQVAGAVNIFNGKGYTLPVVNAQDFTHIQYLKISEWPPLYSYLLVPLLKIFRLNIDTSCYILSIISFAIFLGFFWQLIRQIGFSYIIQFFSLILIAFYIRGYYTSSLATDLMAAGFFLAAVNFFISFLKSESKLQLFITIFFLITTCYTRYMYLPIVFAFPILLAWAGFRQKKKEYVIMASIIALVCISALWPLLSQNYIVNGSAGKYWSKGLYLKNLLSLSPVFWDSFIDKNFFLYQLSAIGVMDYARITSLFIFSNYIIITALTLYFLKHIFSKKNLLSSNNTFDNFFVLGGVISLLILLFLSYTSVTNSLDLAKFGSQSSWTYIAESRYFIFVHLYLLIVFIQKCFVDEKPGRLISFGKKLILLVFFIEVSHGLWILVKSNSSSSDKLTNIAEVTGRKKVLDKLVSKSLKENHEPVFFLSYNYYFMAYASINEIKLCTEFENFDDKKVNLDKPTRLFFIVRNTAANSYYKPFIRKQQFEFVETLDSLHVYSKLILPND